MGMDVIAKFLGISTTKMQLGRDTSPYPLYQKPQSSVKDVATRKSSTFGESIQPLKAPLRVLANALEHGEKLPLFSVAFGNKGKKRNSQVDINQLSLYGRIQCGNTQ